jgi:hypothetical protein
VVTGRNQELTRDLSNPKLAKSGNVTMHATEKKDDYGKFSCSFDVSLAADFGGNTFLVIQK